MKKSFAFLFISLLLIGCQEKKNENSPNVFNPSEEISQVLSNDKAQEYFDMGDTSLRNGDFKSSYQLLNKALEYEKSPIIYNQLGIVANAEEKYDLALKYYSEGKKIDKKYWPIYINESISCMLSDQGVKAEKLLLGMIDICDSNYFVSFANLQLAAVYSVSPKDCDKALDCLKRLP